MFDLLEQVNMGTGRSLVSELDVVAVGENELRAGLLERIAAFDASGAWRDYGAATMSQWLVARYGHSHSTATELVRVARALVDLPEIGAVFGEGGLSWDQLRALTRLATADDDAEWARQAPAMSVTELNSLRRAPSARQVQDVDRQRHVTYRFGHDEPTFDMGTHLVDTDGALLLNALMRIANQADPDPITGVFANIEVRLADALIQMASQSLGADADPDRATVVIHTDLAALTNPERPGAQPARIQNGPTLSAQTLHRLTCDARLQLVVTDQEHHPVGVGRTTRTIAPWLRRAVEARDQGCRFPGCERTRWTHVHHIIHWANGGPTDLDNLILLCGFHHRLVHEQGWRISGHPTQTATWIQPNGRPLHYQPYHPPLHFMRQLFNRRPPITPPRPDPTIEYADTS